MLVDVDSPLPILLVQQEESDSVSVAGDFYFASTEEGYVVLVVEGYIVLVVERYIVRGAVDSYSLLFEEETFLSSAAMVVASILHESISQHRFPEYSSVVYYPNSTST